MNPTFPARLDAKAALARYLLRYPEEAQRLHALRVQLLTDPAILLRSNMRGHITTSAVVLDPTLREVLLVHHRAFDVWLPPGGHYEAPGSLWDSARREVAEETGVRAVRAIGGKGAIVPLDIDTHAIPSRPEKREGAHCHHDFAYLAVAEREAALVAQAAEVTAVRWLALADFAKWGSPRIGRVVSKALRITGARDGGA